MPGIGCEENTTVSPSFNSNWRFFPVASRPRMDEGSPCVPAIIRTTFFGGSFNASSIGMISPSGTSR